MAIWRSQLLEDIKGRFGPRVRLEKAAPTKEEIDARTEKVASQLEKMVLEFHKQLHEQNPDLYTFKLANLPGQGVGWGMSGNRHWNKDESRKRSQTPHLHFSYDALDVSYFPLHHLYDYLFQLSQLARQPILLGTAELDPKLASVFLSQSERKAVSECLAAIKDWDFHQTWGVVFVHSGSGSHNFFGGVSPTFPVNAQQMIPVTGTNEWQTTLQQLLPTVLPKMHHEYTIGK